MIRKKRRISVMNRNQALARRERKSSDMSIWKVVGGAALLVVAYGVMKSYPDIQRYIKIRSM